jgi:pilus assembly protein FimV
MALGFGFNKARVLAAAEKFVQQGKLPNAITEYLKVTKEDPKDLTVMNTVGDLYARLGQTTEALQCFKQVAEAYASEGFIVKAIAIYKKLTKLNPAANDCVLKLAELYSQQGLYNDARAQYLSLADRALRAGDNQRASRIFHKMLELDPENAAMQAKLADLYVKLGNKEEARNIYFGAAESLFRRGAMEAADEALGRVLALDPAHTPALMLRGCIAAETGDAEKAIQCLEKVPDLDSQPEALRSLLRAHLQLGHGAEALPIASKLLNVHNDLSGIVISGDHLMAAGQHEAALRLYDQYADRLLADDHDSVLAKVSSAPAHLSSNPAALELVLKLFRKAGDTAHLAEVMELLAHALVQAGELVRARDLYNQLAALEPENPQHAQNYKQVSVKLGDDAANRPLSADEGAQALMVDELEIDAPPLDQEYPPAVARAIRTALTDSELLDSYNLPAKAIAPLETALPAAPRDALLNQRLASLYARAGRYSDAARCCDILRAVYRKAGHHQLAAQYGEMSAKYHHRAGEPGPDFAPSDVVEPVLEPADLPGPSASAEPPVRPADPGTPAPTSDQLREGDDSQDWEEMTAVEPPDQLAASHFGGRQAAKASQAGDVIGDLLEEIRFYVAQGMWEEAQAAIEKCAVLAPGIPELVELREQVEKSRGAARPIPDVEIVEAEAEPESSVATLVFDSAALGIEEPPLAPPVAEPAIQEETAPPPAVFEPVPRAEAGHTAKADDLLTNLVFDLETRAGEGSAAGVSSSSTPSVAQTTPIASTPPPPAAPPATSAARSGVVTTPRPLPPEPFPLPIVPAEAATIVARQISPAPSSVEPGLPVGADFVPAGAEEPESALAGVFEEFKEDMEAGSASADEEDPETHYNLGVAFKEMGLLEEAIGELQKVCHALDHGHPFPHVLQVYTWLAECLMNKGAPQAAIKWYERVLQLPKVDEETRMAVYYEMAAAYEVAGNRQAALNNFMEVYANNIDYRDVAERIKTLKA